MSTNWTSPCNNEYDQAQTFSYPARESSSKHGKLGGGSGKNWEQSIPPTVPMVVKSRGWIWHNILTTTEYIYVHLPQAIQCNELSKAVTIKCWFSLWQLSAGKHGLAQLKKPSD